MCLAVPGRVVEVGYDRAWVDFQGNRAEVCIALTPHVDAGDWVLVHAGFAITTIDEAEGLATWSYLRGQEWNDLLNENGVGPSGEAKAGSAVASGAPKPGTLP